MALDSEDWTASVPPYGDEQPYPRLSVVPTAGAGDEPLSTMK